MPTWNDVLECWPQLECDLHSEFGVDVDTGILDQRSWRWLSIRIGELMSDPTSRLSRAVRVIP